MGSIVGSIMLRYRIRRAEAAATGQFDYHPIRRLAGVNPAFGAALAERARRLDDSKLDLAILYCLAMAKIYPEVSSQLLERVLPVIGALRDLGMDEVKVLSDLASSADLSTYDSFLGCCSQDQLEAIEPESTANTYGVWLQKWIPSKLSIFEHRGEAAAVADLLKRHPQAAQMVAQRAKALLPTEPWSCLMNALALARNDFMIATDLLRFLIDLPDGRIAWEFIENADLKDLSKFVLRRAPDLFELLSLKLNDEQFAAMRPEESSPDYESWLRLALNRGVLWNEASGRLRELSWSLPEPEDILHILGLTKANESTKEVQENLTRALRDGNAGSPRIEGYLRQLAQLTFYYDIAPAASTLQSISRNLGQMTLQACIPAAMILQYGASVNWLPSLREAWHRIEEVSRVHRDKPNLAPSPDVTLAAFAVARALGLCAAEDPRFKDLVADDQLLAPIRQLQEELRPLQSRYNVLVEEYRALILPELEQSYSSVGGAGSELESELKRHKLEIESLHYRIDAGYDKVRNRLSAGYLMLSVLNRGQRYDIGVRQAAALGLHLLVQRGSLSDNSNEIIRAAIQAACEGEEGRRFRERHVLVPINSNKTELAQQLQEGLQWIESIVPLPVGAPPSATTAPIDFKAITQAMFDHIPGIVKFLERYPLRLMQRDDHTKLLGMYAHDGGEVERWTRYEPPLGVGKVWSRYYELNDRSTPNSMGVDHRLFSHPVLVLPVLFHEYLHYAGVPESGNRPIPNETEVRLREALFTRGLIASMAPSNDFELADYERSLAGILRETDMDVVLFLLLSDLSDAGVLQRLNALVYNTYGGGVSPAIAREQVKGKLIEEAFRTQLSNVEEIWDPRVKWPVPFTEGTEPLFARFESMLLRRATQINIVELHQRDEILHGESSRRDRDNWERYCRRPGSLRELRFAAASTNFAGNSWLDLVVRKPPEPPEETAGHSCESA